MTAWSDLEINRQKTRGWLPLVIDRTSDGELRERTHRILEGTRGEFGVSTADILSHIFLHERGHHGDVTTMLAQLGATPPSIDYLTYVFFKQRQAGV